MTIQQALDAALEHHRAGRLTEAETIYRQILLQQPDHAEALHLLALVAQQVGNLPTAIGLFRKAIAINPRIAEFHSALGNALMQSGQFEQAAAAYRGALNLLPNLTEAQNNLGLALLQQRRFDDAIHTFRAALINAPGNRQILENLAWACNEHGIALAGESRIDDAINAFQSALQAQPNHARARNNLANLLHDRGKLTDAIAHYRAAIAADPTLSQARNNLGNALRTIGELDQAVAAYRQAIQLVPDSADYHANLGNALREQGNLDEAVSACRRAVELNPTLARAYENLGKALHDRAELDEAIAIYRRGLASCPPDPSLHSTLVFALHFDPRAGANDVADEQRRWDEIHAKPLAARIRPHDNDRSPERPLRIGYVSPDFYAHSVGHFALPLVQGHDPAQIRVHCYASVRRPDEVTDQFRQLLKERWHDVLGLPDDAVAEQIRRDGIDILVDLTMHTPDNRLLVFAQRPAPIQATYLAYPGGTGVETIDYRLTDSYLDPPTGADEQHVFEKPMRLPGSYWCYTPPPGAPAAVSPLAALARGYITFGCLNTARKLNDVSLSLWHRILSAVPRSRLILHTSAGAHRRKLLELLGIDPQRITFVQRLGMDEYLATYQQIDIALDPHPYGGGTTTCDALWMGVPVITVAGEKSFHRSGVSLLSNVGLTELIAESPDDYAQLAIDLAADLPRLSELRSSLRQRMSESPLMDAARFARDIDAAYREMWRRWVGKSR